jgi:hypothetical protein
VSYPTFEEWWEPYLLGVGPAGGYVAEATDARRAQLRDRCHEVLGDGPFDEVAHAWCVHARAAHGARGTIAR